ncbi:MAG: 3-dehydroquinate synthase [Desulfococcaceae bacterium]
MKTFDVSGKYGQSHIAVGGRLETVADLLPDRRLFIFTDPTVRRHHGDRFPDAPVLEIGTGEGEGAKSLEGAASAFRALVSAEADRDAFILGIGGGVVCDLTGFVASTYLRGVRFGFVATTLLAQVDASVGGKNGVNFEGFKNMIGVFNQPEFVLCPPDVLATLPPAEIRCGLAEIVKHAAIADADLFRYLEEIGETAAELPPEAVDRFVCDSVRIKAGVVSRDEREAGERRILNFGHTFGHAVESTAGVGHGEAVSIGMTVAAQLSVRRGLISEAEAERIPALLTRMGLPIHCGVDPEAAVAALRRDKKRTGDQIRFVLLNRIGEAVVTPISLTELEAVIHGTN